jgi:hypothetical protein
VGEEGWEVTRADEFSVEEGEMTFARDGQELDIKWVPPAEFAQTLSDPELHRLGTVRAADAEARLFHYVDDATEHVAVWLDSGYTVEVRGRAPDAKTFKRLLASLHEVDIHTWLSAMPTSVVTPVSQPGVVAGMLANVPLPHGFDAASISTTDAVRDRYQLGAQVAGAVACVWIDRWIAARRGGDEAVVREAVDAMATSTTWPVLQQMNEEGDYPEVVWGLAAAMRTDGTVPAGRPATVEQAYEQSLGCSEKLQAAGRG